MVSRYSSLWCARMSSTRSLPVRGECPRRLRQDPAGFDREMEDEHQHGEVEFSVFDRERLQFPLADLDVVAFAKAHGRRRQHLGRPVDRDHALHEGRDHVGERPRPRAEVAHDPLGIEQTEQRREPGVASEQVVAEGVPFR